MRTLKKNKQKMYYSSPKSRLIVDSKGNRLVNDESDIIVSENPNEPSPDEDIYERDDEGNIIYTEVDGVDIPVVATTKEYYEPPTIFYANISFDSGETRMAEYGLDPSQYSAVISATKGELPFDEQTVIWFESEPKVDEYGRADETTADYRVIAIKTSINEERFILKKRVDD